jgi:hypothetical protein
VNVIAYFHGEYECVSQIGETRVVKLLRGMGFFGLSYDPDPAPNPTIAAQATKSELEDCVNWFAFATNIGLNGASL